MFILRKVDYLSRLMFGSIIYSRVTIFVTFQNNNEAVQAYSVSS